MDAWLAPLTKIGARRNVPESTGNTDHFSFTAVGVPAFNPIQTTCTTTSARIIRTSTRSSACAKPNLKQAAIVMATFAYHAAMRAEKMPR